MTTLLDPRYRIALVSDSGAIPSLYVRFLDPIALVTDNYAVVPLYADSTTGVALDADLLVVQRWISTPVRRIVQDARTRGIPVVYETDDDMLDLPVHSTMRMSAELRDNVKAVLAMADLVTCSTRPLAEAMARYNPRVEVIENYGLDKPAVDVGGRPHLAIVNTDYFKLSGSKHGFFQAIADAVVDLDYRVTFFGSVDAAMIALAECFPGAVEIADGFVDGRSAFIDRLAAHGVNVAAVPLDDTAHHLVKSDIKFLDFASLGIPGIFNNPRVYGRVRHRIDGYRTADTQAGWFEALSYFADPARRRACGRAAREVVATARGLPHYAAQLATSYARLLDGTVDRAVFPPVDRARSGFFWQDADFMLLHDGIKHQVTGRPVIAALIDYGFGFIEPREAELTLAPAMRALFDVRQLRGIVPTRLASASLLPHPQAEPVPTRGLMALLRRARTRWSAREDDLVALIAESDLFDADWYATTYPETHAKELAPARHFIRHGARAGRNPGPYFDTRFYLSTYPDVAAAGMNPLVHYLRHGEAERRERTPGGAAHDAAVSAAATAPLPGLFPGSTFGDLMITDPAAIAHHVAAGATPADTLARVDAALPSPLISVLLPVSDASPRLLREALQSVFAQTYTRWELCLIDDPAASPETRAIVDEVARLNDARIKTRRLDGTGASSAALELATGDHVAFLGAHDRLTPNALSEVVACLRRDPAIDAVYADHVTLDRDGQPRQLARKPVWSPELLLTTDYIGPFLVVRRSLAALLDARDAPERNATIALDLARTGARVHHVFVPLYVWREHHPLPDSEARLLRLRERHLRRCGSTATPVWPTAFSSPRMPAFRLDVASARPCTALILLASEGDNAACIRDRFAPLLDPAVTLHVVSLAAVPGAVGAVLDSDAAMFDFIAALDDEIVAFARTTSRYLGVDWLARLSMQAAMDPLIGAAGGKVLDPWLQVRAGGMLADAAGAYRTIGGGLSDGASAYRDLGRIASNVDAVSSQLLTTRRSTLLAHGGIEFHAFGDAAGSAYCAGLVAQGYRIVYDPEARACDAAPFAVPDAAWPRLRALSRRAAPWRRYHALGV